MRGEPSEEKVVFDDQMGAVGILLGDRGKA